MKPTLFTETMKLELHVNYYQKLERYIQKNNSRTSYDKNRKK